MIAPAKGPRTKQVIPPFTSLAELKSPSKMIPGATLWSKVQLVPGIFNYNQGEGQGQYDRLQTQVVCEAHDLMSYKAIEKGAAMVDEDHLYSGDLSKLTCRAGSFMTPCGVSPPVTDDFYLQQPKSLIEKKLWEYTVRMTVLDKEPVAIELNNISSTGFPDWRRDASYKHDLATKIVRDYDRIGGMFRKGDLNGLAKDYRIVFAYNQTYRTQPDSSTIEIDVNRGTFRRIKSKDREVYTFEGGKAIASKVVSGSTLEALRVRLAAAASFGSNFIGSRVPERLISGYSKRYPILWYHRGGDDVCEKLNDRGVVEVVCSDVKNFDQTFPNWPIQSLPELMGLNETAAQLMLASINGAFWVYGDSVKTRGKHQLRGSFDDKNQLLTRSQILGLPSGNGLVTYLGKTWGFVSIMMSLHYAMPDVIQEQDLIAHAHMMLTGSHPMGCILNQGDDTMIGFTSHTMAAKYRKYLKEVAPTDERLWSKMEEETPAAFLGSYYFLNKVGKWDWCPRIESAMTNFFVPESSWGSDKRKYAVLGVKTEADLYGKTGLLSFYQEVRSRAFREVYNYDFEGMITVELERATRELQDATGTPYGFQDLNLDELLFIENPDRRWYGKVNMDNVREDLLNAVLGQFPASELEGLEDLMYEPGRINPFGKPIAEFKWDLHQARTHYHIAAGAAA